MDLEGAANEPTVNEQLLTRGGEKKSKKKHVAV